MNFLRLKPVIILGALVLSLLIGSGCKKSSPTEPQNNNGQSITVNGFVKDIDGVPISGVSVIVKGKSPVITSASGAFSISNVNTPYEIRLILSSYSTAVIYQGLTRSDPTLLYPSSTTASKTATISGNVPAASGKTTLVFFVSGTFAQTTTADPTTGAYIIYADWKGSTTSFTGKLSVLRWTPNTNGLPAQYDAYGSKDLTISEGGTFNGKDFTTGDFTDPAEQSISGSITRPTSNYIISEKELYMDFGSASVFIAYEYSGGGLPDAFSYTVPTVSGATFGVNAYAETSTTPYRYSSYQKMGITGGSNGVTITLASAPQLNLPANNGTNIDTTTQFLWAQGSGTGVNLTYIYPTGSGPTYYIITAGNSTSIPNLSPQGLGLPSSSTYKWYVNQIFPLASIDDAASDLFNTLYGGDNGQGESETFTFTTK